MIAIPIVLALWFAVSPLPDGMDTFRWGITLEQLAKTTSVQKADAAHGYGYAEHTEVEPDVYVQPGDGQKHREFYFFRGKLYKIFTVYGRAYTSAENYTKLVSQLKAQIGEPKRTYDDQTFGIRVLHTEWTTETSTLDLRMGAGFMYEVRYDNNAAREKQIMQKLKHSI